MAESRSGDSCSPTSLTTTTTTTPTLSRTSTLTLTLDINNPADLEAQLLRLKQRHDSTDSSATASSTTTLSPLPQSFSSYLSHRINPSSPYIQAQFLALSFATGILDAVTFSAYSVFVTKQTGNTILLALAALRHTSVTSTEPNIAISISLFFVSAVLFGYLGRCVGTSTRLWCLVSHCISTGLVFGAAALQYQTPRHGNREQYALAIVGLLSIATAAQVTLALTLKIPDLNTTMVTGAIVQLATDSNVFSKTNGARNRRVLFFVAVLGGAFVGAGCVSVDKAYVGLFIAGVVKSGVVVMVLF